LNGRFHGLVVDGARGTVTLFNDRYGLQRIYYHESKDAFYFAAEAKAILKVRPELRGTDPRGSGSSSFAVVCSRTGHSFRAFMFYLLGRPGPFAVEFWRRKRLTSSRGNGKRKEPFKPEEYYAQLRDVFVRKLPRYFNGDEQVGVSLTGGLDTRIIMAWRKAAPGSLPCYTFGSMYRDNEDVQLARRVAKICGHRTRSSLLARSSCHGSHITPSAPLTSRTRVWTSAVRRISTVNEKAREIAPVRMVGTYGSEILLHSVMFKAVDPVAGLYDPELSPQIRAAKETYDSTLRGHPVTFVRFPSVAVAPLWCAWLGADPSSRPPPYLDNDLVKTVYKAPGRLRQRGRQTAAHSRGEPRPC